jgi:hypothetical protein
MSQRKVTRQDVQVFLEQFDVDLHPWQVSLLVSVINGGRRAYVYSQRHPLDARIELVHEHETWQKKQ